MGILSKLNTSNFIKYKTKRNKSYNWKNRKNKEAYHLIINNLYKNKYHAYHYTNKGVVVKTFKTKAKALKYIKNKVK